MDLRRSLNERPWIWACLSLVAIVAGAEERARGIAAAQDNELALFGRIGRSGQLDGTHEALAEHRASRHSA